MPQFGGPAGRSFILWRLGARASKVLIIPVLHLDDGVRHLSKRGMWVFKVKRGEGLSTTQDKVLRLHRQLGRALPLFCLLCLCDFDQPELACRFLPFMHRSRDNMLFFKPFSLPTLELP